MFVTVIRNWVTHELVHYLGHMDAIITMPEIPGKVLQVYLGTYDADEPRPQVILANRKPGKGPNGETFELVFRGPREEAIEIFEAHVGMLL
jgi:hypothetical protein